MRIGTKKVVVGADLRETNVHLGRIATALEGILYEMNPNRDAEPTDESSPDYQRFDGLTPEQEEILATIEILADRGVEIPAESYKMLGLDPPRREDEPTEEEVSRPQPGNEGATDADEADEDETVVSSKDE